MKHIQYILSIFLVMSLLMAFTYAVRADESVYLDVNFDDGEYTPLTPSSATFWEIVSFEGHLHCAHEKRTNNGPAYLITDWTGGSSYEISMAFYVEKLNSATGPLVLVSVGTTGSDTSHSLTVRIHKTNNDDEGGYLYVNMQNTTKFVTNNVWHSIFINVTETNRAYYALDNDDISDNYIQDAGTLTTSIFFGSQSTNNNNDFYLDDILVATRLGDIPVADFTYDPEIGDGLTNFVFTDISVFDSVPYVNMIYWDFGDGNGTYGEVGGIVNHTYIHAGTYQVVLNASNKIGYDLAYTNITVDAIIIGGGVTGDDGITDEMFGFIALLALITALNLYALKSNTGLLSIFALLGLVISVSLLWPDSPITTALMLVTVLGNIAITIKTVT